MKNIQERPLISFVLVNWNTKDLLLQCIHSIKADCMGLCIEIIVVDNASVDGSPEAVEETFPSVKIIRNKQNLGFAKANNVGIKVCTGEYLCLVNTDVEIVKGCFNELLNTIKDGPSIGIIAPKVLNGDGSLQRSVLIEDSLFSTIARIIFLNYLFPDYNYKKGTIEKVDAVSGCFWLIRREALEMVGYLDEEFFFYGEDKDYCKRMRLNNWQVVYNPKAVIYHYCGGSSKGKAYKYYIRLENAHLKLWKKYHNTLSFRVYYLLRLMYQIFRCVSNLVFLVLTIGKKVSFVEKTKRSWFCALMLLGFKVSLS